jgi:uncharacterized membrane protein
MRKDRFFSHQLVQSYLEDFSKRLHDLPPDVKQPFIQKVRSDLYEKAMEKEKKGVSPEEIPQSVLMEFLSPNELAADLLKECDREDLNHHVIKLSYSTVLAIGSFGALSVPILLGFINVSAILPFVIGFIIGNMCLLFGKFTWNRTLLSHFQKTMRFIHWMFALPFVLFAVRTMIVRQIDLFSFYYSVGYLIVAILYIRFLKMLPKHQETNKDLSL